MISIVIISKNENALEYTLGAISRIKRDRDDVEVLVVDASEGKLEHLRSQDVVWIDFPPLPDVSVTIPHQRNLGVSKAKGDIIVFTDSGCEPKPGWLDALVGPILQGREDMVTGIAMSRGGESIYDADQRSSTNEYVNEANTINLAFRRTVFDEVGGFDERFEYGSDVDFSWRVRNAGVRILRVADAVVTHDWGTRRRQIMRSYVYGRARARLYRKHPQRFRSMLRDDPIAVVYPLFLLGAPLTLRYPLYPALLAIPVVKNRRHRPVRVVLDHLLYGAGVLRELVTPWKKR